VRLSRAQEVIEFGAIRKFARQKGKRPMVDLMAEIERLLSPADVTKYHNCFPC